MSLTRKQKSALRAIVALMCLVCVFTGLGFFVWWSGSTASVQKYCSGSALITITTDHGGSTGVTVKDHGCESTTGKTGLNR